MPTRRSGQKTSGASSRAVRAGRQRHVAEHQAQADTDRDERDTEGGQQFEHERRQKRDTQRRHRRTAMGRTEFGDPMCGSAHPAQCAQRGNARNQIQQP